MSKKLVLLLLPLFLILGFLIVQKPASTPVSPAVVSATVTTVINDGQNQSFYPLPYQPSQTALGLLQSLNLPLEQKTYSFGTLVESINGLKNTSTKSWIYFVNGKSASVGADTYQVQPGDQIEWKFIPPTP